MDKQRFLKHVQSLLNRGQVIEAHQSLSRYLVKAHLNYSFLDNWIEIVAATECAPLKVVQDAVRQVKLAFAERAVLDSYLFVDHWCRSNLRGQEELLVRYRDFVLDDSGTKEVVIAKAHFKLCTRLIAYRAQHPEEYIGNAENTLFMLGDSHALVPVGKFIPWRGRSVNVQAMPIRGIKMFHLGGGKELRKWKAYFKEKVSRIPHGSDMILSIGEIDCRPNEGMFHVAFKKGKGASLDAILKSTISDFFSYARDVLDVAGDAFASVTLMGVPYPTYDIKKRLPNMATEEGFLDFIGAVNEMMRTEALNAGWDFLDVYSATRDISEDQRRELYIDSIHLSPRFYDQAEQWRLRADGSAALPGMEAQSNLSNYDVQGKRPADVIASDEKFIAQSLETAMEHHRAGHLSAAEALYREILQANPDHPDALHLLGLIAHQVGKSEIAVQLIAKAIAQNPTSAMFYNLGLALQALGKLEPAVENFQKALALKPDYAEAHYSLGRCYQVQAKLSEALGSYQKAILYRPDYVAAYNNLGNVFKGLGKLDEAIECYRKLLALKQDYAEAHNNLGAALNGIGQSDLAVESFQKAIALKPDYADAYSNLGNALQVQGKVEAALACYRRAIELNPSNAVAHSNLGSLLKEQGKLDVAIASYRKAIEQDPHFAEAYGNLANALLAEGKFDAAIVHYQKALSLRSDYSEAYSNLIFALSFHPGCSPSQLRLVAAQYGEKVLAKAKPYVNWISNEKWRDTATPLRVGLVSGDLNNHPVGYFMEGILEHLNPARIELVAYVTKPQDDALTGRIRPYFSAWNSIVGLDDEAAARKIYADGIDILIDLAGHTARNRLPVFAWKPAPVQVSWLGYFATTGVPGIDYLLADRVSVPESHKERFTEAIWYLPDTRLCFTPPTLADSLEVSALPALRNGYVTFGSFQNLSKLNDSVLAVWGRILHALPRTRLRIQNKQMNHPQAREELEARLVKVGITPDRLMIEGPLPRAEYLAAHADVDILLDTFPYPGGTTTCEALWMGVPTLTLAGDTMLSRQGASLLACAGLPDWIANNVDEYIVKAVDHASKIDQLAKLRSGLRREVLVSPLFDAARFALNLEDALTRMWLQAKDKHFGQVREM